jgi:hypothetical protein
VFISELPKDPNVSALLFSTKSWTDERKAAKNRVESYLAKGGQVAGMPMDTHYVGMKSLQVVMFPQELESAVGDSLVLISDEGKALQHEQYVRITKVETRTAFMVIDQKAVEYKIATYAISDALDQDYVGLSPKQWYSQEKSKTTIRDTLVADTGIYYSSTALVSDAGVGEYTVNAKDVYAQLIPSAQTESPIVDVNAAGESVVLVPGNDGEIIASFAVTVGASQNLYIGLSVMPSSMAFMLFGQSITDQGGLLKNTLGTQVGTIDYQRGLIQWTDSAGSGSTTLNITFMPAASPNQYYQSYAIPVMQNSQSTNWTGVLVPIPSPGSLSISYMAQGKFYELKDDGSGQLKGSSSSFGSGRINYETGSWSLTAGALPDVGSPILLLWGTPIVTFARSNLGIEQACFDFQLLTGVAPGVTVKWLLEGVEKTAVSNAQGKFTGDAAGSINYATGKGKLIPNKLPQKSTLFNVTYNFGTSLEQTKSDITPDSNQKLLFTIGTGSAIQPSSIELSIPLTDSTGTITRNLTLTDIPLNAISGNLVNSAGEVQGTINYSTGSVEITPASIYKEFKQTFTPMTVYGSA